MNECGETVSAANDDELVSRLAEHLRTEHGVDPGEDEVRRLVREQGYEAMHS